MTDAKPLPETLPPPTPTGDGLGGLDSAATGAEHRPLGSEDGRMRARIMGDYLGRHIVRRQGLEIPSEAEAKEWVKRVANGPFGLSLARRIQVRGEQREADSDLHAEFPPKPKTP